MLKDIQLPKDWDVKPLCELAKIKRGISYNSSSLGEEEYGCPFINLKSFKKRGGYNPYGLKYYSDNYVKQDCVRTNDFLIANTDLTPNGDIIGTPALLPPELIKCDVLFSHHVTSIQLKSAAITKKFLYYSFCANHYHKEMRRIARGTTVLMLDLIGLNKIQIILPPLSEQRKIAAILSSVDDAIEKTDAIIEGTRQLKKGLMQKLFAEGIGHIRFKEAKIGRIPEEWSVLPAELICEKVTDGTHDTPKPVMQGYPLVTSKNLKDGKLNFNDCYNISEEDFIEVNKRSKVDQYDVLYGMIGTIGSPVMVLNKDVNYAVKNVGVFKTDKDIELGRWLVHFFNSSLSQKFIERQKSGTSQSFVPLGLLRKFPIPIPSNDERLEINRILSEVDNKIEKEEATKEQLEQLKKGLMQVLLTGKVRVKV